MYFLIQSFQLMVTIVRSFILVILSTTVISCGVFPVKPQQNAAPTVHPKSNSPTPKPLVKSTSTPLIISSQAHDPVCIASTSTTSSYGRDCINQNYGFTIHFPSTTGIVRTTNDIVDVRLTSSPSNSRIERLIEIMTDKSAESCFSADVVKVRIGKHDFTVNNDFEPLRVVYAWKSYAIAKGSKSVCFMFVVGFQTWERGDPLFASEEDQGLDEVQAILATFRWLNP